jgi:hypothetical protein
MIKILRLKHWQIFLVLIAMIILSEIQKKVGVEIGNLSADKIQFTLVMIGLIIFYSWILIIGLTLNRIKDNPHRFNKYLLILATIFCIAGYGEMQYNLIFPDTEILYDTMNAIPSILTIFGVFFLLKNVAQSLKSVESGIKARLRWYYLDAFLIFAFPIGIWIIQPRLNKIYIVLEMIENEKTNTKH